MHQGRRQLLNSGKAMELCSVFLSAEGTSGGGKGGLKVVSIYQKKKFFLDESLIKEIQI